MQLKTQLSLIGLPKNAGKQHRCPLACSCLGEFAFLHFIPQSLRITFQFLQSCLFYYLIAVGIFINRTISAECCMCFIITKMVPTPVNLQFK